MKRKESNNRHIKIPQKKLFVLFHADPSVSIGDADIELLGALHDFFALAGGYGVSDLGAIFAVLHHKKFELLDVVDDKFVKSIGKDVAGLLVARITHVDLLASSFELSALTAVNTLRLPPGLTYLHELVRVPALDLLLVLFYDGTLGHAFGGHKVERLGSLTHFIYSFSAVSELAKEARRFDDVSSRSE